MEKIALLIRNITMNIMMRIAMKAQEKPPQTNIEFIYLRRMRLMPVFERHLRNAEV
jgi:hypothetical protein